MKTMKTVFLPITLLVIVLPSCGEEEKNDPITIEMAMQSQETNDIEYGKGCERLYELKESGEDISQPRTQSRASQLFESGKKIEEICAQQIRLLDKLRKELLIDLGEKPGKTGASGRLLAETFPENPTRPDHYDLSKVNYVGNTDFLFNRKKEIIAAMQRFRTTIVRETVSSASTPDQKFSYTPQIVDYRNDKELMQLLEKDMKKSTISLDDWESVKKIYQVLSYNDDKWNVLLRDNCTWETAFGFLNVLEGKVLTARTYALSTVRYRIGCGADYVFDALTVVTPGAEIVKPGESAEFEVFVTAYDTDNDPIVNVSGGNAQVEVRNGKGYVRLENVPKCKEVGLVGTITLLNRSGIPKTFHWRKHIIVEE